MGKVFYCIRCLVFELPARRFLAATCVPISYVTKCDFNRACSRSPPTPSSISMVKRIYKVYRADDSDDENNEDLPQACVISVRKNGERLVESARSPQKRGTLRKAVTHKDWQPSADFEAAYDEPSFDDFDLGLGGPADDPTVVAKSLRPSRWIASWIYSSR
jgi:hypothetical protein